jgi:hypothetical protein
MKEGPGLGAMRRYSERKARDRLIKVIGLRRFALGVLAEAICELELHFLFPSFI